MMTDKENFKSPLPAEALGAFAQFLKEDFLNRIKRNPRFSLRSYAKFLNYDASTLTKIINGRRHPGIRNIRYLSQRLGVSAQEIQDRSETYGSVSVQDFGQVSDWYHYAILELLKRADFEPRPRWIAARLGLGISQVNVAIRNLQDVGLLRIERSGKWRDTTDGTSTNADGVSTNTILRQLQREILKQSLNALETIPVEQRDHSSITVAIDSRRLEEAKKRVKVFRRDLAKFLSASSKLDRVYQISMALFPADRS